MKTTKRSKMLLSSIAMLLVALVALGSASFAWYVSNSYVTASKTEAAASTADGLVIRKTTSDTWAQSITYTSAGHGQQYAPMALDYSATTTGTMNGMQAAKGQTESIGTYTEAGTALTTWAAIQGACAYDDFYVATTKGGATQNVKLTMSGSTIAGTYINVLVFVDGTLVGSVNSTDAASATGRKSDGTAGGTLTFTGLGNQTATFAVSANASAAGVAQNGSHVEVIAFPDGENAACTTNTAKIDAFEVTFRFDKTT